MYKSIPRMIIDGISRGFKNLKSEFGIWAYVLIAFLAFLLYKPVIKYLDLASTFIWYGVIVAIGIAIIYWLVSKFLRFIGK